MNQDEMLSTIYHEACSRCSEASSFLYESLHDDNGMPLYDREQVMKAITSFRTWINIELDLVKEACSESEE